MSTATATKTIFQFASDSLDSHAIFDHNALAKRFSEETGQAPCWPVHSTKATAAAIRNRGLGGALNTNEEKPCAYGWEIAEALADKFTNWTGTPIMGRGGRFRAALEALKKANA